MSRTRVLDQFIKTCERLPSACETDGESSTCGAGTVGCWCSKISSTEMVRPGQGESELGTSR
jgi:hypothetical protein